MAINKEDTRSGRILFGDKSLKYLEKMSRTAVEDYTNTSLLFFEIDYQASKKNFYGELIIKQFVNPLGIEIKGTIEITEGADIATEDIPSKLTHLKFNCYLGHLKELGIDPRLGDLFSVKNRFYYIYDKTILDADKVSIGVDRGALNVEFKANQLDSEQIAPPSIQIDMLGNSNEIRNEQQF